MACNKDDGMLNNNETSNVNQEIVKEKVPSFIGRVVEVLDNGDTYIEVINDIGEAVVFNDNEVVNIGDTGDAIYMSGTNVKVTFDMDIYNQTGNVVPVDIKLLNTPSGYTKLEELPFDYSLEDAINDGCHVISGEKNYNVNVLVKFIEDIENNATSFIRVVGFTDEGDLILDDIKYVKGDNKYYIISDYTRDKFTSEENRKVIEYSYDDFTKIVNTDKTYVFFDNIKPNRVSKEDKVLAYKRITEEIENIELYDTPYNAKENESDSDNPEDYIQFKAYSTDFFNEDKIDKLVAVIANSPKESSAPGDYIIAHQAEYNELIAMDKEALKVMFPRLNTKESGLKEMIQWTACREILGDEDLKLNVNTPYEWYSEYISYIKKINNNSKDFIESNYPKASILIELVEE